MSGSRRGISLLEIVVAMNCTALLMAMLCQVLPLARRQMQEAEARLGGALLAQNALEHYMTVPIAEWPSQPVTLAGDWREVQLTVAPWSGDSRLYLASATVKIGAEERYRLETLIFP
jgi:type II secretory pathway pseudopilin PulG